MTQFDTVDYLKTGNAKQQEVYHVLTKHHVFEQLKKFNPILVGTIPINIDSEESDLDVICYCADLDEFKKVVEAWFKNNDHFRIQESKIRTINTVVANFQLGAFKIELFCQPVPTKQQLGYRHMIVEYNLLLEKGENFRQLILELKRKGLKTEPAFAKALGLEGDPYS